MVIVESDSDLHESQLSKQGTSSFVTSENTLNSNNEKIGNQISNSNGESGMSKDQGTDSGNSKVADIKKTFSPIPNRNDIQGNDNELSGIEEFYLIEIEQTQNVDKMSKLQI